MLLLRMLALCVGLFLAANATRATPPRPADRAPPPGGTPQPTDYVYSSYA
jgi:hypothetical protein